MNGKKAKACRVMAGGSRKLYRELKKTMRGVPVLDMRARSTKPPIA